MPITQTSFDNIKVGYISETDGYIQNVSISDANAYAELNPDTEFIFIDGDEKVRFLTINEVNALTPKNLLRSDPCLTGDQPCGPPELKFFGGGGVGAIGNPVVDVNGDLIAVDLVSGGFGYTSPPQVQVIDPCNNGSGAVLQTIIGDQILSGEVSADQFGNLNLTGGNLYLRGQSSSSYDCMYIPSTGVTVTNTSSHTTHIQPNNTDDEDMYLNVNGNELGNLTINLNQSNHEVYLQSGLGLQGNLTVSAGDLQSVSGQTLTMSGGSQTISIAGGSVTGTDAGGGNDLTLAISSGSTTTFTGNATSNSDHEKKFFNVNVNSGATLELSRGIMCRYGTFTVDGDLQINDNGYVQSVGVSPTYGNSSTLIYNSTGAFGRNHEWTSTSGAGYPNDVSVIQGSVNLGSGATSTARQIAGDLSISSGAGFYMDYGSDDMTAALTINGNISNSGTLSLSGSAGGDLVLKGDFSQNGTFNHNSRLVTLSGSSDQAISTTGSSVGFGFLTINNGLEYQPGEILEVPVMLTGGNNLLSFEVDLTYDPNLFLIISLSL